VGSFTAVELNKPLSNVAHENAKVVLDLTNTTYLPSADIPSIAKVSKETQIKNGGVIRKMNANKSRRRFSSAFAFYPIQ